MNASLLLVLLAVPDAGVPAHPDATAPAAPRATHGLDAGVRAAGTPDGGTAARPDAPRGQAGGETSPRNVLTRGPLNDDVPMPPTRVNVQEPARPDAGTPSTQHQGRSSNGGNDPQMEALLEQSRRQTEALQQLAAQEKAAQEARLAEQQARTDRGLQLDGARSNIDGTLQSLQLQGNWDSGALQRTRQSIQATAAAAQAAGASIEASRAAEAARLVQAAEAALSQRNSQQAQYYLLQANQLLWNAQVTH
jgi:hypothetical protein